MKCFFLDDVKANHSGFPFEWYVYLYVKECYCFSKQRLCLWDEKLERKMRIPVTKSLRIHSFSKPDEIVTSHILATDTDL
jgi:hypothetical protein